jgi:adenylosuccinate synthase
MLAAPVYPPLSPDSPEMPATVICGLQWGDEGKGKATDLLAHSVSHVVRYQGGDNAGHTVVLGDEVFKLHLVPSTGRDGDARRARRRD